MEMMMNDFALGVLVWKFSLALLEFFWHSGREKSCNILSESSWEQKANH
jgi:hypothetical protein